MSYQVVIILSLWTVNLFLSGVWVRSTWFRFPNRNETSCGDRIQWTNSKPGAREVHTVCINWDTHPPRQPVVKESMSPNHKFGWNALSLEIAFWIPHCYHIKHISCDDVNPLLYKMDDILPTTIWNSFSWMKNIIFLFKFQWNLFPRVKLTICQHCRCVSLD